MIAVDLASNSNTIADSWGKPRGVPSHVVGRRGSLSDRSRSIRVDTSNVAGVYPVTMHLLGSRVHNSSETILCMIQVKSSIATSRTRYAVDLDH